VTRGVRVVDLPNKVTVVEDVVVVQVAAGIQGPQGPQGVQGVQGVQGEQGIQGVPGDAATIAVGTTSTLAPGSSATVANSGTTSAAVFDFGIPEGVQGPPGLDGTGAPIFGQVAKMTSGTITIGAQGVYQSTGLTAVLDGENAGISLGTSDLFAIKNTSGATRRLKISASYDASMAGATKVLGLALAINGVVDLDTECRATTGIQGAIAKLATAWIIDLADGDEVALFVANHSSTVDIDFQRGRIVATSVAGFGPQGVQGPQGPQGDTGIEIDSVPPSNTNILWADTSEPGDEVIPPGGATGQVLVKVSGSDYDSGWAQPGVPTVPPVVGEYMVPDFRGVTQNTALNNNQMQATVLYVPRSVTIDEIGIAVTAAGLSPAEGRLGIYDADSNGKPNNLIVDAGIYDATTPGDKLISLSPAVTLPQGIVFLVNCRQSVNSYQVRRFVLGSGPRRGSTIATAIGGAPGDWGAREFGVSGALPSNWTGTTPEQGGLLMTVRIASII
jgi:hypothetical protein